MNIRNMIAALLVVTAGLGANTADAKKVWEGRQSHTFPDFAVYTIEMESHKSWTGEQWCKITDATMVNEADKYVGYVYTRLDVFTKDGVTAGSTAINFPPTVAGGKARAVHADKQVVANTPCESVTMQMRVTGLGQ